MDDLHQLRLTLPSQELTSDQISDCALAVLAQLLKDVPKSLPKECQKVQVLGTHLRPHLDEYMAMLLFKACLAKEGQNLPLIESVLTSATHDSLACTNWAKAAVFGLGGVQNGGARPLLVFDEHVLAGASHTATSSTALVTKTLLGEARLPRSLFLLLREIDLIDACGGAHPKHLANYTLRLHDYAELCTPKLSSAMKQAIIEACLAALLLANEKKISYWEDSFWRKRALVSLKQAAQKSNLHKQNGFEQALTLLQNNLNNFRQPRFQLPKEQANPLSFPAKVPVLQSLLIPYLAALLPLVYGEELGGKIMGTLWEARLLTQMRYATCLAVLEEHFGLEPEDGDLETSIGLIRFRNVCISCGNAEMMPWIIEVTPKPGLCNVRQALISFVRKHHADTALTLLRNLENGSLVLSRGLGIPKELWDSLVNWLIATEGSSDLEGEPGCWHVVTSALGTRADFILNGNAAHQYVPKSKLTVDLLAEWVRTHACN